MDSLIRTIKPILDKESYETDVKDNYKSSKVEMGDTKEPGQFYPQAKLIQWNNETNFSIRYAQEVKDSTHEIIDGTVIWKTGDLDKEVHLYELDSTSCYNAEDGGFEFEVILKEKPLSNDIYFTVRSKGLDFFYQPEITDSTSNFRAEHVVGSYAVYHSTKSNTKPGADYRTGKAFHIFRPKAIDSKGTEVWCDLFIDIEAEILTITVPQEFIDKAVYPITIDPTFGNTTGGSSYTLMSTSDAFSILATNTTEHMLVDSFHFYGKQDGFQATNYAVAVWHNDGWIRDNVGNISVPNDIAVAWYSVNSELFYFKDTSYYYGIKQVTSAPAYLQIHYDSGNTYDGYYDSGYPVVGYDIADFSASGNKYSVYLTYNSTDKRGEIIKFTSETDDNTKWTNDSNASDDDFATYAYYDIPSSSGELPNDSLTLDVNDGSSYDLKFITKVELRYKVYAEYQGALNAPAIYITPEYVSGDGDEIQHDSVNLESNIWDEIVDITNDTNAPAVWTQVEIEAINVRFHGSNDSSYTASMHRVYEASIIVYYSLPKILYYRKGGFTYGVTIYDVEDGGWDDALPLYINDTEVFIALDTDTGHANASDMRVRIGGVTYALLSEDTDPEALNYTAHHDNNDWELNSFPSGGSWDSGNSEWDSEPTFIYDLWISTIGSWMTDYRPTKIIVTFTGGGGDVNLSLDDLVDESSITSGDIFELDWVTNGDNDIELMIMEGVTSAFSVTNIEFGI